jgi:hypothetical protein
MATMPDSAPPEEVGGATVPVWLDGEEASLDESPPQAVNRISPITQPAQVDLGRLIPFSFASATDAKLREEDHDRLERRHRCHVVRANRY